MIKVEGSDYLSYMLGKYKLSFIWGKINPHIGYNIFNPHMGNKNPIYRLLFVLGKIPQRHFYQCGAVSWPLALPRWQVRQRGKNGPHQLLTLSTQTAGRSDAL